MIICAKYWKNGSRIVDFFKVKAEKLEKKLRKIEVLEFCYKLNWSRIENVAERTRFSRSRSNDLEDIGKGQRSSHATHLLMLVMICTKYGNNPSRTVAATERTWFSRSRSNDLENIGQGQRSLHATHPLILMMICAKYGKNAGRIEYLFFKVKAEKFEKLAENWNLEFCYKLKMQPTP